MSVHDSFVFVPGIYGHYKHTWLFPTGDAAEVGTFWPQDLLCQDFPQARVFSYSYKRPDFTTGHPESLWEEAAEDLVHKLSLKRRDPAHACTPIIWIAHSLGGLIAKAVCTPFLLLSLVS